VQAPFKVTIVVLLMASCLAQNAPEPAAPAADAARRTIWASSDIEVLSDTTGVDFGPYLHRIIREIRANWIRVMPQSVIVGLRKGKVSIEFVILRDGKLRGMHIANGSGDAVLDRAAWSGVTASDPFPALPNEFSGKYLKLRLTFHYNPSVSISPSGHVRVPAGASQQFSANVKTGGNGIVNWSVVGSGCAGANCGTISVTGLFTAPLTAPHPATVTVTATLASDPTETASTKVDIVQTAPLAGP
jgi:TonB family protein